MKVYKVELLIIDEDVQDEDEIISLIENQRFLNHSLNPTVVKIDSAEIGEWEDDNLLNKCDTQKKEYERLFNQYQIGE